jgi:O-antigen ligase
MDAKTIQLNKAAAFDRAIEKGVILLLIFTPLAFGTVYQWSALLMQIAAFCLLLILFLKNASLNGAMSLMPSRSAVAVAAFLFAGLAGLFLLQMIPLPEKLLGLVSPSAMAVFKKFGNYAAGTLHTISINPYATRQELFNLLAYAAVFYVIVKHYRTKEQLHSLIKTVLGIAGFLVLFAIIQKLTWNGRVFWFYPVDERLSSGSGIWGPYINRNHFAGYLEMVIPLGLALLIYSSPDIKTLPGVPFSVRIARFLASDNLVPFIMLFLGILVMSACLFMTLSRGGIIAFGVSALFFAWITNKRRSLKNKTLSLVLIGIVILAVVVLAGWDQLEKRLDELQTERHISRLKVWEESLGIIKDYPLLGSGFGTFEYTYMRYQKPFNPLEIYTHAHNDYVELMTDSGIAGFCLTLSLVLIFFIRVYREWRTRHNKFAVCVGAGGLTSFVAIGIHSIADFNLHIPANALLLSVIAGITYASVFNLSAVNESSAPVLHKRRRLTVSVAVAVVCLLLYLPMRDLIADYYFRKVPGILHDKSNEYLVAKPISAKTLPDYVEAIGSLNTAIRLSPDRSIFFHSRADLYTRLGTWSRSMKAMKTDTPAGMPAGEEAFAKAISNLKQAIALEPTNPDYHLALGLLYGDVLGDSAGSEAELNRALDAFPSNPALRYVVAKYYLRTGLKGNALEQARLLADIDRSYILPDTTENKLMIEQRTDTYLEVLYNSYLFAALDIAWLASKDPDVVKGIAPDTPDAKRVVQAYIEWRGIEE